MPARRPRLDSSSRIIFQIAATKITSVPVQAPVASPGEAGDPLTGYLADLVAATRDELRRADAKAALLLAAIGVIVGALLGCFNSSHWTPTRLQSGEQVLWWAGVATATVGLLLIAASVYPRDRQRRTPYPGPPAYYGDVAALPDIPAFRLAVGNMPDIKERLFDQAYSIAGIARIKYGQLRRGLVCFLVAVIVCGLSVALDAILH